MLLFIGIQEVVVVFFAAAVAKSHRRARETHDFNGMPPVFDHNEP